MGYKLVSYEAAEALNWINNEIVALNVFTNLIFELSSGLTPNIREEELVELIQILKEHSLSIREKLNKTIETLRI